MNDIAANPPPDKQSRKKYAEQQAKIWKESRTLVDKYSPSDAAFFLFEVADESSTVSFGAGTVRQLSSEVVKKLLFGIGSFPRKGTHSLESLQEEGGEDVVDKDGGRISSSFRPSIKSARQSQKREHVLDTFDLGNSEGRISAPSLSTGEGNVESPSAKAKMTSSNSLSGENERRAGEQFVSALESPVGLAISILPLSKIRAARVSNEFGVPLARVELIESNDITTLLDFSKSNPLVCESAKNYLYLSCSYWEDDGVGCEIKSVLEDQSTQQSGPLDAIARQTCHFLNAIDVLGLDAEIIKPILWGTLHKRGRVNTGWQKRLFVLQSDGTIYYFNSVGHVRGSIQLAQVIDIVPLDEKEQTAPSQMKKFVMMTVNRTWKLYAETAEETKFWMETLKRRREYHERELRRKAASGNRGRLLTIG